MKISSLQQEDHKFPLFKCVLTLMTFIQRVQYRNGGDTSTMNRKIWQTSQTGDQG